MALALATDGGSGARTHHPVTGEKLEKWMAEVQKAQPRSLTQVQTELYIAGTDESITLPVLTSTLVIEVKMMLATRLGLEVADLVFVTRQGACWRKQHDMEEVARKVSVRGIPSFKRQRHKWDHPFAIIGAGHAGLRTAMWLLKHKDYNFTLYDRKPKVGGTSWWDQANTTSKLQTELGTYHLQYDEDNPVPTNMKTWPTRDELLAHFQEVAEEYGVLPYCKMNTDVRQVQVMKEDPSERGWFPDQKYCFQLVDADGFKSEAYHSAVCYYPGNLTVPKREEYHGEEQFNGYIEYAICNTVDYSKVIGEDVCLIGHGAFAVENVRTCCETGSKKVWMVCRRRNLACPRVVSWLCNQSYNYISAALYLRASEVAYKLTPFDPWAYHSVFTNEKRTHVSIQQKARFGIGDVYFLAIAMGMLEVIEGKVKRLTEGTVHLETGEKLKCSVLFKLFGFSGAWEVDRLLGVKEIVGYWVNSDFRRALIAEPIGVNASNFGGTSFSPGVRSWVDSLIHFFWYPKDFRGLLDSMMLPQHKAEQEKDRPAYVIDARHGTQTGMVVSTNCMHLAESGQHLGILKHNKQLECHPMEKYLQECRDEWDDYARTWKARGAPGKIPEYPYTEDIVKGFLEAELKEMGLG